MNFSTLLFLLLFLPAVLGIYYAVPPAWRNFILVAASIFFYVWGAPQSVGVFLVSVLIDFMLVLLMERFSGNRTRAKIILAVSVGLNIGLLAWFKYANFCIANLNRLLGDIGFHPVPWAEILLPIGISFFVFHKISYVVDIYRHTEKPFRNIIDYTLYLLLFPQLIAGPIVRFHEIAGQIRNRRHNLAVFYEGILRFSIGLGKKVVIANSMGQVADGIFRASTSDLTFWAAWVGIVFYAFQIYFDFSGYSDMAIGLGKMFGFYLPENFNRPYTATSITDFWRRWNMSLSRFFRDYVYIPLGGNRCSKARNYFNLWTVFLLCGLWHGANWTFVVWGAYHGLLLVIEKAFLLNKTERIPETIRIFLTFILVLIGWVFFRSDSAGHALLYLKAMFQLPGTTFGLYGLITRKVAIIFGFAAVCSFANCRIFPTLWLRMGDSPVLKGTVSLVIFAYSLIVLSAGSFNPFIYFRF